MSEISKNTIIVILVLMCAVLVSYYGVNINGFINKTSEVLSNSYLSGKKEVKLADCIDGDTVKLNIDSKIVKVRFLAIDTPEIKYSNNEYGYGKTASNYTCNKLKEANQIMISYENNLYHKDKYNRDLVWVYVDNELIQEQLVKEGLARVRYIYAKYKYTDRLLKLEREAKEKHIGIWHDYVDKSSEDEFVVVYKFGESSKSSNVRNNHVISIIDNPIKKGYLFKGWTYNNKLFDLSQKITSNIILEPSYKK